MKICNMEAMKKIKQLEEEIRLLDLNEKQNCIVSYKEGEEKSVPNYDYASTRKAIEKANAEVRKIKFALSIANTTYKIDEFNITISEALVYLAQLSNEYDRLSSLASRNKISRRITANGVLEYTECLYDTEEAKKEQRAVFEKISKLQVAIDRANLNCFIEI